MTADAIAEVVANLRDDRWLSVVKEPAMLTFAAKMASGAALTVVDSTKIYEGLVAKTDPVALYEDHPCIAPPWDVCSIVYENQHGNVVVMVTGASEHERSPDGGFVAEPRWETAESIDWATVRWVITTCIFSGGRSQGKRCPTAGPLFVFQHAVGEHGEPLDLHWVDPTGRSKDRGLGEWDMAQLVHLGTLNFMSARNIELAEPKRPRPQQKRIARTGVRVQELHVFPASRSRSGGGTGAPLSTAAHGVVGHWAHYGDCCPHHEPRGLLFGRLTGKVWVPTHVRGSSEIGEITHEYVLRPESKEAT